MRRSSPQAIYSITNFSVQMDNGARHSPHLADLCTGANGGCQPAVSMDFEIAGKCTSLVVLSCPFLRSHYALDGSPGRQPVMEGVPSLHPITRGVCSGRLHTAILNRLAAACHDLSEGGWQLPQQRCVHRRAAGLELDISRFQPLEIHRILFGKPPAACWSVSLHPTCPILKPSSSPICLAGGWGR